MSKMEAKSHNEVELGCSTGNQNNPMMNSVVLQTVFDLVSLEDLRVCRQVSRLWFEESLKRWRRDIWVKISDSKLTQQSLNFNRYLDCLDGSSSDEGLFRFGKYPYRKFILKRWDLKSTDEDWEVSSRQRQFWNGCGPRMTHLEINNSYFHSAGEFEAIVFRNVPNLEVLGLLHNKYVYRNELDESDDSIQIPSEEFHLQNEIKTLKHLKLKVSDCWVEINDDLIERRLPVTWSQFFRHFPNLESLALSGRSSSRIDTADEFGDLLTGMLAVAQEHGVKWKLTNLDVLFSRAMYLCVFENEHANLLRQLQFPLTTLYLNIGYETVSDTFKVLLETFAFTLRNLVVYRCDLTDDDTTGYGEPFPFGVQLDSLSDLCLAGAATQLTLNFLPFTPNLRRLAVVEDIGASLLVAESFVSCHETLRMLTKGRLFKPEFRHYREVTSLISDTDFGALEDIVCPKLEEFVYSSADAKICVPKQVGALAKLMPHLKTLMLGLGNDGFRVTCNAWKDLEVLIAQPYDIDDAGITGILPTLENRLPNLSDLKRLRYFGMGHETRGHKHDRLQVQVFLSDDSVLNGILLLENLQNISVACSEQMSANVFRQLKSKFPYTDIRREYAVCGEFPEPGCRVGAESSDSGDDGYRNVSSEDEGAEENNEDAANDESFQQD